MNFNYSEADEYEADFIATGAIEFDELDDGETMLDLDLLDARIQAARHCGA